MITSKDVKLMGVARSISHLSKDPSSKIGALIVGVDGEPLTWGYNGLPRGMNDDLPERQERPLKYSCTAHAEANAIYSAARSGIALKGSRIFVTLLTPCNECAKAIIQAGIKEVILEEAAFDESNPRSAAWLHHWPLTKQMFIETSVEAYLVDGTRLS